MFVWTFLLRITHTIISQSSADSSWITLYVHCRHVSSLLWPWTWKLSHKTYHIWLLHLPEMQEIICPLQFSFHATLTHSESTSLRVTELLSWNIKKFSSDIAKNVIPHINSIIHCLPQIKMKWIKIWTYRRVNATSCLVGCGTGSLELTDWTVCLDKLKIQFLHFHGLQIW
jgi:hypothetical protein